MASKFIKSKVVERENINDFILFESASPSGSSRKAVEWDDSKHSKLDIGHLVDKDGSPITFKTEADAKSIDGLSLVRAGSQKGLNHMWEAYAIYLKPFGRVSALIKSHAIEGAEEQIDSTVTPANKIKILNAIGVQLAALGFEGI